MRIGLLLAVPMLSLLFTSAASADEKEAGTKKLKIGTPAAPDSPWGSVFKTWRKAVEQKTDPDGPEGPKLPGVSFDFYFNSTQGSEATMIDKMKAGQLDGAAVTSLGLSKFDKRLQVLQLPGVIRSWKTLEAVRNEMGPKLEGYLASGTHKVTLINWGDIGQAHFISKGFMVKGPADMKDRNPWVYADDPILKAVYANVKGASPYPSELMQVLPNIDNGKINCLSVPALAAEMLQWNSKFDNGVDAVNGIAIGALIIMTDSLEKLPADGKEAVLSTSKAMGTSNAGLKEKLHNEDEAAWKRFKSRTGVNIFTPTEEERQQWRPIFKAAIDSLKATTFPAALVDEVIKIAQANGGG